MFTKSLLDFPQFVAANSQANTEGWAEAASLEVVAMSDAAKAAEWDIWTLEGYEEDGEVVIVEA